MDVEYRQDSPYAQTRMQGTHLDIYEHRPIPSHADDVLFTNNERLWWVFMVRNPNAIEDPIWDFLVGRKIYIPKQDTLTKALGI